MIDTCCDLKFLSIHYYLLLLDHKIIAMQSQKKFILALSSVHNQ
uniref:Uncharacterized protein n=1 Tax=Arundo donax TaxID=35708 RepID=A0A0A8XUI1_ARUDO